MPKRIYHTKSPKGVASQGSGSLLALQISTVQKGFQVNMSCLNEYITPNLQKALLHKLVAVCWHCKYQLFKKNFK
jgi:hypothetical protein